MAFCLCPNCVKPMVLIRAIGREVGLADLNIFECKVCHVNMTEAVPEIPNWINHGTIARRYRHALATLLSHIVEHAQSDVPIL